jgi:hypothetical protein
MYFTKFTYVFRFVTICSDFSSIKFFNAVMAIKDS